MQIWTGRVIKQSLVALLFLVSVLHAQTKTISDKDAAREAAAAHKIFIVPFETRMYMSEVDHRFHEETNMSSKEIRFRFRMGLTEAINRNFKSLGYTSINPLMDTAKYFKDLSAIYGQLGYAYLRVPDQNNYKVPTKEKEERKVQKGQLTVETNSEERFMDARLNDPKLLPSLHSKYASDVFVFINQLDIKAANPQEEIIPGEAKRRLIVHYTIFTKEGVEINSGVVVEMIESDLNNPKKIIEKYFPKIAQQIAQRATKALSAPVKKQ